MLDAATPALEKTLREMDVLAKMESGEFAVMLPGKTQGEAAQTVKRMRAAVTHCILPLVDRELQLGFREGIAELKSNETAQELLARARQATLVPAVSRKAVEV